MPKDKNQKTQQLEQQLSEHKDKLARSLADYANLEKRIDRDRQMFITLATTSIISKMIDVVDDFYLAQNHLQDQGLQIAIDKFVNILKSEGLEEIDVDNREFDPQVMDCVEVAEGKQNFVVAVKKRGYKLNDHVVRPVQVVVGKEVKNSTKS